jgi:ammonium transporter, Amt family
MPNTINTGDTAWILISAALVMLMTPGLALFYGGMVRRKNLLSTMMMSFALLGLIGILWMLYGYSLAFGTDHAGIIGGFDFIGLRNVGQTPSAVYATTVPQLAFMIYQAMFAIITVALFTGAVVERMKFGALLIFSALWFTLIYCPVAHWVWGGGWLAKLGAVDFAGGIVVHITAGVSALALAMVLGPRKGFKVDSMEPNNIPLIVLGAALLWFGWFGFNAGSALQAGGLASSTFVTTYAAGAAAGVTWMTLSWMHKRPTLLGTVTGAIVGLAAVTPASGYITPLAGLAVGVIAAFISYYAMVWRNRSKLDESLDVWACHGLGGTWGTIAAGLFATAAVNAGARGLVDGSATLLWHQLIAIVAVWGYSFIVSYGLARLLKLVIGIRVSRTEETIGLDISQHGERAYGGFLR